jgi:hypothetical protein
MGWMRLENESKLIKRYGFLWVDCLWLYPRLGKHTTNSVENEDFKFLDNHAVNLKTKSWGLAFQAIHRVLKDNLPVATSTYWWVYLGTDVSSTTWIFYLICEGSNYCTKFTIAFSCFPIIIGSCVCRTVSGNEEVVIIKEDRCRHCWSRLNSIPPSLSS